MQQYSASQSQVGTCNQVKRLHFSYLSGSYSPVNLKKQDNCVWELVVDFNLRLIQDYILLAFHNTCNTVFPASYSYTVKFTGYSYAAV